MITTRGIALVALCIGTAVGTPLSATGAADVCSEHAASGVIHIAICGEDADDAVLVAEGQRFCGTKLPCGVWFWIDVADAPSVAPENHDGLTQSQVTSAIGVYVAEQEMLIRIAPAAE